MDRLRADRSGRRDEHVAVTSASGGCPPAPQPGGGSRAGFVVIDVETTGLSAAQHRILELAVLRTDPSGTVVDEWVQRFNPCGPVGATHIHGITDVDVRDAPLFSDVLPVVTSRLKGAAVAGHNVRFDLAFLRAEYARANWALPHIPVACTLEASREHQQNLDRRRLVDCCAAAGIPLHHAHSALDDARATAALLAMFLQRRTAVLDLAALPTQAAQVAWPTAPGGVVPPQELPTGVMRKIAAPSQQAPRLLDCLDRLSLDAALDDGAPVGSLGYLELLAECLEDGVLTEAEREALDDLAQSFDLDEQARAAAHRGFLLALAHEALADGKVTRDEKAQLQHACELLEVPAKDLTAVLDAAEITRNERLSANLRALPDGWPHGEPLRVGDKVVFTGCDDDERKRLERRAEQLGVRVIGAVSNRVAMLVTDGSFSGGKAADAERLGTRVVSPAVFSMLLDYLQPAQAKPVKAAPVRQASGSGEAIPAQRSGPDPALVREWVRERGIPVGDRGRLPASLFQAYEQAHPSPEVPAS